MQSRRSRGLSGQVSRPGHPPLFASLADIGWGRRAAATSCCNKVGVSLGGPAMLRRLGRPGHLQDIREPRRVQPGSREHMVPT